MQLTVIKSQTVSNIPENIQKDRLLLVSSPKTRSKIDISFVKQLCRQESTKMHLV
jgi:hypothetical protein